MTETKKYDNPNDIHSISTLKIQAVSGNLSPSIYANGRNQLPIQITVKALNKDGKPLDFSHETWIRILNLRFAESDRKLTWKGNSGWCFTDKENDYSKEIQAGSHRSKRCVVGDDGTVIIIMYVYSDEVETKRIAVSLDTDTDTDNGKHFTTADIASGAERDSLIVKSISAINYSDKINIMIESGDFVELSSNLGWTSRLTTEGPYKEHNNGTCKRKIVRIYPNNAERKFKKHEVSYDPIKNSDVNSGSISWAYGANQPIEDCFSLIQGGSENGYPCAVIGRGANQNDYQLNVWFSRLNYIHIDGKMYTVDKDYYYRFCPFVKEDHLGDDEEGIPTILLYKFTMPQDSTYQWKWHDVIRPVNVKVTDFYGNEGTLQLTFNDTDKFDIPGIV